MLSFPKPLKGLLTLPKEAFNLLFKEATGFFTPSTKLLALDANLLKSPVSPVLSPEK